MKASIVGLWMVAGAVLLATGCTSQPETTAGSGNERTDLALAALQLKPSSGCNDLKGYLEASWLERLISPPIIYLRDGGGGPVALEGAVPADAVQSSPDDVSQTNTQEAGVDEADLVKADRNGYLYAVSHGLLVVEQGFPPRELHEVSRLDLGADGHALYLDEPNRRLVVVASNRWSSPLPLAESDMAVILPDPTNPKVVLIFVNVADPTTPVITDRLSLDGYAVGSRRVHDRIHLVSRWWIPLPAVLEGNQPLLELVARYQAAVVAEKSADADRLKQEIRAAIHLAVESLDVASLLPRAARERGGVETTVALLSCGDVYRPDVQLDPGLLVVTSVDTDGANPSAAGVMNNAWLMYASPEHLYVSQSSGGWWWNGSREQQTAIYKFGLSGGPPTYLATGRVDGWVKDQFSFSEYQGHLRVAATEDRVNADTGQRDPINHLFVLKDAGAGTLAESGAVRGLARGERIFAVRFLEDRGFVVTFRQVDPLFAFDLSDPANPLLKGEVEIPGFSTYVHPMDRDHLLTVGRAGNNVQLQMFDVSDLAHPVRTHQYVPLGAAFSYSGAEYDHLAFTYYGPRNVLVIPLVTGDAGAYFSGMAAYRVSMTDGFAELGRVDHTDLAKEAYCSDIQSDETWRSDACANGWYLWGAAPRRSVVMTSGDATYLYSVSDIGIKATAIDAPGVVLGRVLFPNAGPSWWEWYGILEGPAEVTGAESGGVG
ncbi:MAG: beta-propeller domain-containing protein [Nitrospirota bacterium]